jgi:hypothetical protein
MRSPSGPPRFDQQEWKQFDFSRWHLDGITGDAMSTAVADLAERLFNSEEWRRHFKATLPDVERGVLTVYRVHARELREERATVARDFEERIAAALKRSDEFGRTMEAAAAPPIVPPDPETFHLAVKVTADQVHGLPGVAIRLLDPRDPKAVLVENVTDRDGNAILTVPRERAAELDKSDTVLEVRSPGGKALQKVPVRIRRDHAETSVVAVHDAPGLNPLKAAALDIRSEREAIAHNLVARIERLKRDREARLRELDRRLESNEKIVAMLEQTQPPGAEPSGSASQRAAPRQAERTKKARPAGSKSKKRRPRRGTR